MVYPDIRQPADRPLLQAAATQLQTPVERGKIQVYIFDRMDSWWGVTQVLVPEKVVGQVGESRTVSRLRRRLQWKGNRGKTNLWDPP